MSLFGYKYRYLWNSFTINEFFFALTEDFTAICCLDIDIYSQLRKHSCDVTSAHWSNDH